MIILHEFAKYDKQETCQISKTAFRHALANLRNPMYAMDLEHLLARFNLKRRDGLVDYLKFVEKLQSRSNLSLFNKMLPKLNHRLYADGENPRVYKDGLTASEAEVCLLKQCHRLFLQLLTAFRKADISDHETVSYHEFKEILEKVFQIQLTKDQLDTIVNKAGYLENNLVDYPKFLLLFQDRPSTCELKEEVARFSLRLKDQNIRVDRIRYIERFGGDLARYSHAQKQRPLQEVNLGIVGLSRISFVDFVGCFQETKVMKNKWMILTTLKQLQDNDTMLQNSKTSFLQQKSSGKLEESIKNDFTLLKQKMHERGFAMQAHFPPSCLEVGGAITAKQLKEALESMGIIMNKNDFNNLWVRIDAERKWKVPTQQFLTQMGINSQGTVHCTTMLSPNDPLTGVNEDLTRTQAAKSKQKTSNSVINFDDDVIKIFKVKLDEACMIILHEFAKYDKQETCQISKQHFGMHWLT
ncbi:uncharacterized protein LOC121849180 [Callorhinchus milii]|uniref:uncharacterized protein LOC121849180 n=1 Tax=Callorhinchus milii TaxID=7868 RepID=UPI001C3F8062|nr:uncharacterized protein LOC121849180 [Callorhinchus milii]